LDVPIYATRLTNGLIQVKLKEYRVANDVELRTVAAGDTLRLGSFTIEFFHVCHSIPDGIGLAIHTPLGTVVHSGDFKFDQTPVDGKLTDYGRLSDLGRRGVLALLSDSTNAEKNGFTPSEQVVSETFDQVFSKAHGRVIVATFASNISRIQQVVDTALRYDRRVTVMGRSMVDNVRVAMDLGYLTIPNGTLLRPDEANRLPHRQVAVITTGSQGEPTSALTKMANKDFKLLSIEPGDTVIISATPIPGNEELINHTIDNLFRLGANVIYEKTMQVHVSGHGSQEDQKLMLSLVRPRYFIPIHGEYRHLCLHARLAEQTGVHPTNIFVVENGSVVEFSQDGAGIAGTVPAGRVFVDGLGVGDVGEVVLRDRRILSQDGVVIVSVAVDSRTGRPITEPDILTRGFVYERESEELLDMSRERVRTTLESIEPANAEWSYMNNKIKEELSRFLYEQTHRRPMIFPVVVQV
jgi:ribonuclease J